MQGRGLQLHLPTHTHRACDYAPYPWCSQPLGPPPPLPTARGTHPVTTPPLQRGASAADSGGPWLTAYLDSSLIGLVYSPGSCHNPCSPDGEPVRQGWGIARTKVQQKRTGGTAAPLRPPPPIHPHVRAHALLLPPPPAGLLYLQHGPLGLQLAGVLPLPPRGLDLLAARHPRVQQLAWRAVCAWHQPDRPGHGVLELNGGWRARSLQELQAACVPLPPLRQQSAPAAMASCAGRSPSHVRHQQYSLKRPRAAMSSGSGSARGGAARPAPVQAASAAASSQACTACSASAAAPTAADSATSCARSYEDSGGEVCSGPKRPRHEGSGTPGSSVVPDGAGSPLSQQQQLPRFTPDELNLLQDLLVHVHTPHHQPGPLACP